MEQEAAKSYEDNNPEGDPKREASANPSPAITEETNFCVTWAVTSIVVEQGSFQTELRIVGNSNKLVYFHHIDLKK